MSKPISTQKILKTVLSKYPDDDKSNSEKILPIELNKFKKVFHQEAKIFYARRYKDFAVDSDNQNFLNLFCKYFTRDPSFETEHQGSLNKGLYVFGNKGSGKTTSFQIMQLISKKYNLKPLWFPFIEAQEVVNKFNEDKNKDSVIRNYSRGNFMFDDLGAEIPASNIFVFGKEDIFIRILEARYNDFIERGVKTYLTSNLSLSDIKERYGERVEDRFHEMFNLLELNVSGDGRR